MTLSQEAVNRYDFWLSFIWDEYKLQLVCLAFIQAILLWAFGGTKKKLLSLPFAIASAVSAWLLCATTLWLVFKVPNATLSKLGVLGRWALFGIPIESALVAFAATTVAYLKITRGKLAV